MPALRMRRRGAGWAGALLVLTACGSDAVQVEPVPPSADAGCPALMEVLPGRVGGHEPRVVTPSEAARRAAAWGDPPIVLRCGVPEPAALERSSPCTEIDGVGWFAEQKAGGVRFTTISMPTYVEVWVPDAHTPESAALVDLAKPIRDTMTMDRPCV